jgi:hypothetical protein
LRGHRQSRHAHLCDLRRRRARTSRGRVLPDVEAASRL